LGEPTWDRTDCRGAARDLGFGGSHSVWPAGFGPGAVASCVNDYPHDLYSWLSYGPFDLTDATAAEVTLQYWARIE